MKSEGSSISACLIVRNEETHLADCLESLRGAVAEICVVDTGSTDSTVEIAQRAGARVQRIRWVDDFSAARNVSLEMASSDWVLVLDADERLVSDTVGQLARVVRDRYAMAFLVDVDSLDERGNRHRAAIPRLFRAHPKIRYRRRVHESVMDSLFELGHRSLRHSGVRLDHLGYLPEELQRKDKHNRNLRLLAAHHRAEPDDLYNSYKYAATLLEAGQVSQSLAVYESAAGRVEALSAAGRSDKPFLPRFYSGYADALCREGQLGRALNVAERARIQLDEPLDLSYRCAEVARRLGHYDEAVHWYLACLDHEQADDALKVKVGLGLSRLALSLSQPAQARTALAVPLSRGEPCLETLELAVRIEWIAGDWPRTVEKLQRLTSRHGLEPRAQCLAAEIAWAHGDKQSAESMWLAAVGTGGNGVPGERAGAWLAMMALAEGNLERALEHAEGLSATDLSTAAFFLVLDVIQGRKARMDPAYDGTAMLAGVVPWLQVLLAAQQHDLLQRFRANAYGYDDLVPTIGTLLVDG